MSEQNTSGHGEGVVHVYDGIEEMDNRLPNWWLGILWGTILFGVGYWMYYAVAGLGPDLRTAYAQETAALKGSAPPPPSLSDETLLALGKDPAAVEAGKALFGQSCAACHGAQAQGLIGPNLTDTYWLHGGKPLEIAKTVSEGVLDKGMPAWERTLGPQRVQQLVAYVLTLKNTNVPGKPPQGEQVP